MGVSIIKFGNLSMVTKGRIGVIKCFTIALNLPEEDVIGIILKIVEVLLKIKYSLKSVQKSLQNEYVWVILRYILVMGKIIKVKYL